MATIYGDISPAQAAYSSKELLKRAIPYMVLEQFGAAVVLALVLRFNNHAPGGLRALVCTLLLALTAAHANYLMAAGFIAGQMGLELLDALRIIGLDMAYSVARAHADRGDAIAYGIALGIALLMGYRQPGELASKDQPKRRKA